MDCNVTYSSTEEKGQLSHMLARLSDVPEKLAGQMYQKSWLD